jgi:hypothetical protein
MICNKVGSSKMSYYWYTHEDKEFCFLYDTLSGDRVPLLATKHPCGQPGILCTRMKNPKHQAKHLPHLVLRNKIRESFTYTRRLRLYGVGLRNTDV